MIIMVRHTGMLLPYSLCSVKITVIVIIFRSSKTSLCVEAYVLARARVCVCVACVCVCADGRRRTSGEHAGCCSVAPPMAPAAEYTTIGSSRRRVLYLGWLSEKDPSSSHPSPSRPARPTPPCPLPPPCLCCHPSLST